MPYNYSKLKGKITEVYGTQSKFAKALEMGASTLNLKLNNNSEWTQDEMMEAINLLSIPPEDVKDYFFTHQV